MSEETQKTEEEPVVEEATGEGPYPVADEDEANESSTEDPSVSEMRRRVEDTVVESTERMKEAGRRPILDLFGIYAERIVDGFQGMADGFAGKKRDK